MLNLEEYLLIPSANFFINNVIDTLSNKKRLITNWELISLLNLLMVFLIAQLLKLKLYKLKT